MPKLLLLLFLLLYALDLAIPRDFWIQDEARYGEVVREMVKEGHWLVPHLNGYSYPDKPAPYFWLVAGVGTLIGHGELPFRLVTVASTAAAAVGVYRVSLSLFGPVEAFWATLVFLTTFLSLIVGHIMRMDMLLAAASVHAWKSFLDWQTTKRSPFSFWGWVLLGVAVKGPIALLFTWLPALVASFWEGGFCKARALRQELGLGALLFLVSIWVGMVVFAGEGNYLSSIWHEQLVGRTVRAWSHPEPFWFYGALLPILLMPWTGLVFSAGKLQENQRRNWISFTIVPLCALSLISGKLFIYLEPLFPGFSVIVGVSAVQLLKKREIPPWIGWPPVLFFGLLAIAVARVSDQFLLARETGFLVAEGLAICSVVSVLVARSTAQTWLTTQTILSVVLSWWLFGVLLPVVNPLYSGRSLGEYLTHEVPPNVPIAIFSTTRGILNYYAKRTFFELDNPKTSDQTKVWTHPNTVFIFPAHANQDLRSRVLGLKKSPEQCQRHETFFVERKLYYVVSGCRDLPTAMDDVRLGNSVL
ncbi:4-amino-4-deoxy-L-arabinose transferase [Gammaproteobacteria bacterium]